MMALLFILLRAKVIAGNQRISRKGCPTYTTTMYVAYYDMLDAEYEHNASKGGRYYCLLLDCYHWE